MSLQLRLGLSLIHGAEADGQKQGCKHERRGILKEDGMEEGSDMYTRSTG